MKNVLMKHRSIRKYRSVPIPEEVLHECLEAAVRASTCGNMQLYSRVTTRTCVANSRPVTSTNRWSAKPPAR